MELFQVRCENFATWIEILGQYMKHVINIDEDLIVLIDFLLGVFVDKLVVRFMELSIEWNNIVDFVRGGGKMVAYFLDTQSYFLMNLLRSSIELTTI